LAQLFEQDTAARLFYSQQAEVRPGEKEQSTNQEKGHYLPGLLLKIHEERLVYPVHGMRPLEPQSLCGRIRRVFQLPG
jgi:hypothetical protein